MIVLLTGADAFSRQEALAALVASHDEDGSLVGNRVLLDGASVTLGLLRTAALTVPFLAPYRLVRVDGLCDRFEPQGEVRRPRPLGDWEGLGDLLAQTPPSTLLVFVDGTVREANPIRRMIAAGGSVQEFAPPPERTLPAWVQARARTLGLRLTPSAAALLVGLLGRDLGALASELAKLRLYAGEAPVDEAAVEALVDGARQRTVFQFVDAVAEGRGAAAFEALASLRAAGEPPLRLVGMLARQARLLTLTVEGLAEGQAPAELRQRLGVADFVVQRLTRQARRFNEAAADATVQRVLAAATAIQHYYRGEAGGQPADLAIELLVGDLLLLGGRSPAATWRA